MATDIDRLRVVYEIDDAAARAGFARVGREAAKANAQIVSGMSAAEKAAGGFARQVGGMGRMVGPAAVQIGDFAVQVAAGTSAMRAASQQLPQLLGYFGTFGMVAGGLTAILLPLAGALLRAGDASGDFAGKLKAAKQSIDALAEVAGNTQRIDALRQAYGLAADEVERLNRLQMEAARATALLDIKGLANALAAQGGGGTSRPGQNNFERIMGAVSGVDIRVMTDAERRAQALAEKYGLAAEEAVKLSEALAALGSAGTEEEVLAAAVNLLEVMKGLTAEGGNAAAKFGTLWSNTNAVADAAKDSVEAVTGAVRELTGGLDLSIARFGNLHDVAKRLWGIVGDKFSAVGRDPAAWESAFAAERANGAGAKNEALVRAAVAAAADLGVAAKDLLAVTSFESGNDPSRWGGAGGKYLGLIQFSPENQRRYGVSEGQSVVEQMKAVVQYLKDTGVRPGDSLANIYAAVLAGDARKINASDLKAGGVVGNVSAATAGSQFAPHIAKAEGLLGAYGGVEREVTEAEAKALREKEEARKRANDEYQRGLDLTAQFMSSLDEQLRGVAIEAELTGKSAEEQARLRAEYELTAEAKRKGIDLTQTAAGTEKTYAELIHEVAAAKGREAAAEAATADAKKAAAAAAEKIAEANRYAAERTDQLVDGLIEAALSADDLGDAFRAMGKVAQQVFMDIAKDALKAALTGGGPMAGQFGIQQGGGLLSGLLGWLTGAPRVAGNDVLSQALRGAMSYDGGGYTGPGSRSGGIDGKGGFMAVLHPDETVIDHARGQSRSLTFSPTTSIVIQGGADERTVDAMRRELDMRDARLRREMPGVMRRHQQMAG